MSYHCDDSVEEKNNIKITGIEITKNNKIAYVMSVDTWRIQFYSIYTLCLQISYSFGFFNMKALKVIKEFLKKDEKGE